MKTKKFYDIHFHAMDLSHANLTAFINRFLQDGVIGSFRRSKNKRRKWWGIPGIAVVLALFLILWMPMASWLPVASWLPISSWLQMSSWMPMASWLQMALAVLLLVLVAIFIIAFFYPGSATANLIFSLLKRCIRLDNLISKKNNSLNLLSFMEGAIEYDFLVLEAFLREKDPVLDEKDHSLRIGDTRFSKIVLCPLVMDFGYGNINNPHIFYNIPPKKPVTLQTSDLFRAIQKYYTHTLSIKETGEQGEAQGERHEPDNPLEQVHSPEQGGPPEQGKTPKLANPSEQGKTPKLANPSEQGETQKQGEPQEKSEPSEQSESPNGPPKRFIASETSIPKEKRLFEIYPFMGINTKNYSLAETRAMLTKYFGDFDKSDTPEQRKRMLFEKMGQFDGNLDHADGQVFRNIFAGIKLYPPLGFEPWPDKAEEREKVVLLYETCVDRNIPVITHCSTNGFLADSRYRAYSDPSYQWAEVLKHHPRLKINFAHFGAGKQAWQNAVSEYILNDAYRVYADFSCNTIRDKYYGKLARQLEKHGSERMANRILFGTDFMIHLLWVESYNQYLHDFISTGHLTEALKVKFASVNPEDFLFG